MDVGKFKDKKVLKVLVVGDIMMDHYVHGSVSRVSPEAPVLVVDKDREEWMLGGAANVAMNVASLGGRATLAGVLGNDIAYKKVVEQLSTANIQSCLTLDGTRPTTTKTRVISGGRQLIRVDDEATDPVRDMKLVSDCVCLLDDCDVLVLSDYAKGVVSFDLAQSLIKSAKEKNVPVVVDPKGDDYSKYKGTTMLTPNEIEALQGARLKSLEWDDTIRACIKFRHELDCEAVLVTRGADGLFVYVSSVTSFPAYARSVVDVTGAGDTVAAAAALALACGMPYRDVGFVASCAAAVVVDKFGTATVSAEELAGEMRRVESGN